jgi:hypothetical protein
LAATDVVTNVAAIQPANARHALKRDVRKTGIARRSEIFGTGIGFGFRRR